MSRDYYCVNVRPGVEMLKYPTNIYEFVEKDKDRSLKSEALVLTCKYLRRMEQDGYQLPSEVETITEIQPVSIV